MGYEFNDSELCMCDRCREFFPADEMYQLKDNHMVCENCGLCQVYHGKDIEDVYKEYIEGSRTFDEIAKEYRRSY